MRILCRLNQHDWDWATETVHLRGDLKVTINECKHCHVRRGNTTRS